jgi:hypothetical protein
MRVVMQIALALLVLTSAAAVHAQQASGSYDELVKTALGEFQLEHWAEARSLFEQAHALNPNARTLRGIGLSAYQERRYVLAIDYLERALADQRRPLTSAMRKETEGILGTARRFVVHVHATANVEHAEWQVDGHDVVLDAKGDLVVDPGEHEVVARAEGYQDASRMLDASTGTVTSVELTLQPVTAVGEAPGPGVVTAASTAEASSGRPKRLWTWVALGAAGAFAITGAVSWAVGAGKVNDVEDTCQARGGCTQSDADALLDSHGVPTFETLTTVALCVTAASLVAGGVLFFVEGAADETPPAQAGVRLDVSPLGVVLRGAL